MSKNLNSNPFASLNAKDFGPKKTKIKVTLWSGGRLWLPNVTNGSIEVELLKHRVGRSQIRAVERVEVTA